MRILVAPDKFKGSLTAREAADAIGEGVRRAAPGEELHVLPLADGGEGTTDAIVDASDGFFRSVTVSGPFGEPVSARLGIVPGTIVLEMAAASGFALAGTQPDALSASSRGTGELILAALARRFADRSFEGEVRFVIGVGDSASTDAGTGAAAALGWRFLDRRGRELEPGGGCLKDLAAIDGSGARELLARFASFTGACDVDNPLTGPRGAARTFAPQKGASPDDVEVLEEGLANVAERIRLDLGMDVSEMAMGGAGGGFGAGLVAFFGATLASGFELVAERAGLDERLRGSDLVLTGEGRLDEQTLSGKTVRGVGQRAAAAGIACIALAGEVALDAPALQAVGITKAVSLVRAVGRHRALADAHGALAEVAETALGEHLRSPT